MSGRALGVKNVHRITALMALAVCLGNGAAQSAESHIGAHPSGDQAQAAQPAPNAAFPSFLPSYFAPALQIPGIPLHLADHQQKGNQSRYVYVSSDQVVSLTVESLKCDSTVCNVVYDKAANYVDTEVTKNSGRFRTVTPAEFRAEWQTGLATSFLFVFRLPSSLLFWTFSTRLDRSLDIDTFFDNLRILANRQRYDDALRAGNVELGHWDVQIREWARALLRDGKKAQALSVLKQLLATSPFDYQAHMDFIENTDDAAAARASARVVLENAEDPLLIAKVAHFLGITEPNIESLPPMDGAERGLKLILIPLPPCNVTFLENAARIYEKIADIPTKVMRLPEPWRFGAPDRIADQKNIRQAIIQQQGPDVDFTGWTKKRYESELLKGVASKSALTRFSMQAYVDKLEKAPGQYLVTPYMERLEQMVGKYRTTDARTMYVGVTEANIFAGDYNYVFSQFITKDGRGVSLLSYGMMMAKTLGEPYESQPRLAERMAKELVPASLKALNIPRPSDPSDPYSYSSGVDRLSQKGLVLSQPVKDALDKFRDGNTKAP
jgi:hypothetical protein